VSLVQLKALVLKPPGKPAGAPLSSFCEITARNVLNDTVESGELRAVSMRRLRDYVCRDLSALLNCASLEAVVDLTNYPHVQGSVVNFGMPSLAGRTARTVDPQQICGTIEAAIRRFEPRLSAIRVQPELSKEGNETHVLAFRIEAQLWGQPLPQQLVLRTSIDIDSGNVSVSESGAA
jgi:type VI secretion system protein ImpF